MAEDRDADRPYWSIDMPGLDEHRAAELAGLVRRSDAGIMATPVDPRFWLTLHLDRETVEVIREALAAAPATAVTAALVESFDEWLDRPADTGAAPRAGRSAHGGEDGAGGP
ncbi:hypothetical protein [Streptomyces sp. NPDC059166]|uniref:hypothetical protein n=1 Tax=Streptomyces sp. NPDC059166 TaxID=3346752 RepID=UPI00369A64E4